MFIILFAPIFGIISANVAANKGYSGPIWFIMGFVFSIFGLILIGVMPRKLRRKDLTNQIDARIRKIQAKQHISQVYSE